MLKGSRSSCADSASSCGPGGRVRHRPHLHQSRLSGLGSRSIGARPVDPTDPPHRAARRSRAEFVATSTAESRGFPQTAGHRSARPCSSGSGCTLASNAAPQSAWPTRYHGTDEVPQVRYVSRKLVLRLEISPHHADPAVSHDLRPIGHRTAMSRRGRTCASGVGPGLALELRHSVVRKQFPIRALEHPHENSREDEDATYDYHIGTRRSSEDKPNEKHERPRERKRTRDQRPSPPLHDKRPIDEWRAGENQGSKPDVYPIGRILMAAEPIFKRVLQRPQV